MKISELLKIPSNVHKINYSSCSLFLQAGVRGFDPQIISCIFLTGLVFFCFSASAFAISASNSDQQLTEVACRYEMKVIPHDKTKSASNKTWFFWRKTNMIQTQNAGGDYGELWERTANGGIQYRKLYPGDKTAVEYMPADNPANNMNFDWFKLSGMLSQQELDALKPVKKTQVIGHAAELRKGTNNGQTIEVLWLPDENLPAKIIRIDKSGTLELRLVEITPLSAARRKPLEVEEINNYRQIDTADFGDMENDPFVKKLMAVQGQHHH
jgi:hypothetical protein